MFEKSKFPASSTPKSGHRTDALVWVALATSALALLVSACATSGGLGRQDVIRQYPTIEGLDRAVTSARTEGAAVLAPESFEVAQKSLNEAVDRARSAEKAKAETAAQEGLDAIMLVNENLAKSRKVFGEALSTRQRALESGAKSLFKKRFDKVETELTNRARAVERGDIAAARQEVATLVRSYAELELDALKQGQLKAARAAVQDAKDAGAAKYSPQTLAEAEQELELLAAIMEADRTQTEKADTHAERTIWLAHRATEITELANDFEDRDLDDEGIILWYQRQLLEIREPLEAKLPFDRPNAEVVRILRQDLSGLLDALRQTRMSQTRAQVQIAALQEDMEEQRIVQEKRLEEALDEVQRGNRAQVSQLRATLEAQQSKAAREARSEEAAKERFGNVRAIFLPDDGQILREGDNIILRLYGFDFDPGKSALETRNFALVNRIANALNVFPDARALITGHTDSTGNDASNMKLSLSRATNVKLLLEELGGIPPARLEAQGRGESEPVATNESREGRAKNRRIDVLIVNETSSAPGRLTNR